MEGIDEFYIRAEKEFNKYKNKVNIEAFAIILDELELVPKENREESIDMFKLMDTENVLKYYANTLLQRGYITLEQIKEQFVDEDPEDSPHALKRAGTISSSSMEMMHRKYTSIRDSTQFVNDQANVIANTTSIMSEDLESVDSTLISAKEDTGCLTLLARELNFILNLSNIKSMNPQQIKNTHHTLNNLIINAKEESVKMGKKNREITRILEKLRDSNTTLERKVQSYSDALDEQEFIEAERMVNVERIKEEAEARNEELHQKILDYEKLNLLNESKEDKSGKEIIHLKLIISSEKDINIRQNVHIAELTNELICLQEEKVREREALEESIPKETVLKVLESISRIPTREQPPPNIIAENLQNELDCLNIELEVKYEELEQYKNNYERIKREKIELEMEREEHKLLEEENRVLQSKLEQFTYLSKLEEKEKLLGRSNTLRSTYLRVKRGHMYEGEYIYKENIKDKLGYTQTDLFQCMGEEEKDGDPISPSLLHQRNYIHLQNTNNPQDLQTKTQINAFLRKQSLNLPTAKKTIIIYAIIAIILLLIFLRGLFSQWNIPLT